MTIHQHVLLFYSQTIRQYDISLKAQLISGIDSDVLKVETMILTVFLDAVVLNTRLRIRSTLLSTRNVITDTLRLIRRNIVVTC